MPHAIVRAERSQARAERQQGGCAIQRLDLGLRIDAQHERAARWLEIGINPI